MVQKAVHLPMKQDLCNKIKKEDYHAAKWRVRDGIEINSEFIAYCYNQFL